MSRFLDFYFATLTNVFLESYWAFVAVGDEFTDSFDSTFCESEPPEYDSLDIVRSLLEFGHIQQSMDGSRCRLLWESGAEAIEYITDMEGAWGGTEVVMQCRPVTFVPQFRHVNRQFDRIYLHNQDCAILTPNYFELVYVNEPLKAFRISISA